MRVLCGVCVLCCLCLFVLFVLFVLLCVVCVLCVLGVWPSLFASRLTGESGNCGGSLEGLGL